MEPSSQQHFYLRASYPVAQSRPPTVSAPAFLHSRVIDAVSLPHATGTALSVALPYPQAADPPSSPFSVYFACCSSCSPHIPAAISVLPQPPSAAAPSGPDALQHPLGSLVTWPAHPSAAYRYRHEGLSFPSCVHHNPPGICHVEDGPS